MAIANAEHELRPGDLIVVSARISWLEQEIVDRICREFECRPVLKEGPITLERLHAR